MIEGYVIVVKIIKNATYEYEKNIINENNGYTKWYDREKMRRKRTVFMIWMRLGLYLSLFLCAKFKGEVLKVADWRFGVFLIAVFFTSIFIIVPLRDLVKLTVVSSGKLNGDCLMSCYKDPGSVYNGFVNKKEIMASLLMSFVLFSTVFITMAIFTQGFLQMFALFMLAISIHITTEDLYMLAYCIKYIDKNDVVFGEYKR